MSQPRLRSPRLVVTRVPVEGEDGPVLRYSRPVTRRHIETDWHARNGVPRRRAWKRRAVSRAARLENRQRLEASIDATRTANRERLAQLAASGGRLPGQTPEQHAVWLARRL